MEIKTVNIDYKDIKVGEIKVAKFGFYTSLTGKTLAIRAERIEENKCTVTKGVADVGKDGRIKKFWSVEVFKEELSNEDIEALNSVFNQEIEHNDNLMWYYSPPTEDYEEFITTFPLGNWNNFKKRVGKVL